MSASAVVKALEEIICHSPDEVRDVLRGCMHSGFKAFLSSCERDFYLCYILCFTCRHLWVTAQQNRVPRLLLNEPEIGNHYFEYRNIILNSGCFSGPSHCQCSSHCLKQIFSHAPLHNYTYCMDLTHTVHRKTGIQDISEYL